MKALISFMRETSSVAGGGPGWRGARPCGRGPAARADVSSVDEMMPPITTVASGRCTSAPVPVLSAIGRKPSAATSATIRIGRSRSIAPSRIAASIVAAAAPAGRGWPRPSPRPSARRRRTSVMKPTPAVIDSGMSRSHSAITPPVSASGTPLNTSAASLRRAERHQQQPEDQRQRDRHEQRQPLRRGLQLLEGAAVVEPVARRQLDLLVRSSRAPRRRSRRGRDRARSPMTTRRRLPFSRLIWFGPGASFSDATSPSGT